MVLDIGRVKHRADLMHRSVGSNGLAIPSNWRLSADGLTNTVWTPESTGGGSVSYGSNSNDVGLVSAAGASSLVSRADHVHRGVRTITSNGSNGLFGDVNLVAGTGIALGVAGQGITILNTGGSGGGGSISLSNSTPLVESGSGSAGTGTAASRDDHVHPADGGGGGSTIAYGSNKPATPTDDFTTFSGWTAEQNNGTFATTDCYGGAIDGSHLSMGFKGAMGYVYQSASNVDQEWQCGGMRGWGQTGAVTAMMFGIALLDASEDGMGMLVYNDNNVYLARITGGQYASFDGSITNIGHNINHASRWDLRLTRVGNTWDGYASLGGQGWAFHASATGSRTITVARKCIGVFYNTADQYKGELVVDWVHTV